MSFIWPSMLWVLLAIPLLVLLYILMQQRRQQFARQHGSFGVTQQADGRRASWRHLPAILFLSGIFILFLSLARPQMVMSLPKVEGIVILAFDVSGSMSATDFEPTRMEAAKAVGREFVMRQPSTVQVGIVSFSDNGFSVQLPTDDRDAILASIDRLQPQTGTSIANGIVISLNTIANVMGDEPIIGMDMNEDSPKDPIFPPAPGSKVDNSSAVIVLLTDGENNMEPDPLMAAQLAAERGVRIHTIGVGSAEGMNLEVNGFTVFTRLDEATLQQISEITGGTYYNAKTDEDLQTIYENIDPKLVIEAKKTEVTAVFAGISILILLIGGMISLLWFSHVP